MQLYNIYENILFNEGIRLHEVVTGSDLISAAMGKSFKVSSSDLFSASSVANFKDTLSNFLENLGKIKGELLSPTISLVKIPKPKNIVDILHINNNGEFESTPGMEKVFFSVGVSTNSGREIPKVFVSLPVTNDSFGFLSPMVKGQARSITGNKFEDRVTYNYSDCVKDSRTKLSLAFTDGKTVVNSWREIVSDWSQHKTTYDKYHKLTLDKYDNITTIKFPNGQKKSVNVELKSYKTKKFAYKFWAGSLKPALMFAEPFGAYWKGGASDVIKAIGGYNRHELSPNGSGNVISPEDAKAISTTIKGSKTQGHLNRLEDPNLKAKYKNVVDHFNENSDAFIKSHRDMLDKFLEQVNFDFFGINCGDAKKGIPILFSRKDVELSWEYPKKFLVIRPTIVIRPKYAGSIPIYTLVKDGGDCLIKQVKSEWLLTDC